LDPLATETLLSSLQKLGFFRGQIETGIERAINALWDHEEEVGGGAWRRGKEMIEKVRQFSIVLNRVEAEVTKRGDSTMSLAELQDTIRGVFATKEGRFVEKNILVPLEMGILHL